MTRKLFGQIGRYGLVGLFVLTLDYVVFAGLLSALPGQHLAANLAGKLVGAGAGFLLHKYVSFAGTQRDGAGRQAFSYALLLGFNLLLSSTLLWLLVDNLHLNAYWARLFVDAVVIAVSFLGSKLWVYRAA
jgi:putative flippase GtrA